LTRVYNQGMSNTLNLTPRLKQILEDAFRELEARDEIAAELGHANCTFGIESSAGIREELARRFPEEARISVTEEEAEALLEAAPGLFIDPLPAAPSGWDF